MEELNISELIARLEARAEFYAGLGRSREFEAPAHAEHADLLRQVSAALQSAEARAREAEWRVTVLAGAAKAVHAECLEARASADDLLIRDATLNRLAAAIQALGASHG